VNIRVKIGTMPACRRDVALFRAPQVGDVFDILDSRTHGSKPERVRLTDVKSQSGDDLYYVELW
jgi:hypothetical protein